VRDNPRPPFFHLSFASPLPHAHGAPGTFTDRRRPPETHRCLEAIPCHRATSVSSCRHDLAQPTPRVPQVLWPPLLLHLGPQLDGGSRAIMRVGARWSPPVHASRCMSQASMPLWPPGWAAPWAALASWPDTGTRLPHLVDQVCGLVLAQRPVILFKILVYFKYSLKFMQISKIPIKLYKHQNIAHSVLLESIWRDLLRALDQIHFCAILPPV
jgi:hypothetical protein